MAKSYTEITEDGDVVAPFGAKTMLVNTGSATVLLNADETETELSELSPVARRGILSGLYSLRTGESRLLPVGTHQVQFSQRVGRSLVLIVETKTVNSNNNVQKTS